MNGNFEAVTPIKKVTDRKRKKSKLALISLVLGLLYVIYLVVYFTNIQGGSGSEAAGSAIAAALVLPHLLCVFMAVIFNALGYFINKRGFILVGAILYTVSIVFMVIYFMFVILQMILSYIAYAKMPVNSPGKEVV